MVPFNMFCATKYNCHVNLELCASSVKYIYKCAHPKHVWFYADAPAVWPSPLHTSRQHCTSFHGAISNIEC